jgi:hypothetical protein
MRFLLGIEFSFGRSTIKIVRESAAFDFENTVIKVKRSLERL